jgi:hypothetical protein
MTNTTQKNRILESLKTLDQVQTEKVLAYIHGLTHTSREDASYQRLKREAMKEIHYALGKDRKLNPAF